MLIFISVIFILLFVFVNLPQRTQSKFIEFLHREQMKEAIKMAFIGFVALVMSYLLALIFILNEVEGKNDWVMFIFLLVMYISIRAIVFSLKTKEQRDKFKAILKHDVYISIFSFGIVFIFDGYGIEIIKLIFCVFAYVYIGKLISPDDILIPENDHNIQGMMKYIIQKIKEINIRDTLKKFIVSCIQILFFTLFLLFWDKYQNNFLVVLESSLSVFLLLFIASWLKINKNNLNRE